jgi:DNA polymerase (family 10)
MLICQCQVIYLYMENDALVNSLELLVKLWDVHGIHEFKAKNIAFSTRGLDKFPGLISQLSPDQLLLIPGVGKVIVQLIYELAQTGTCKELEEIIAKTPAGILDLLKIKGLGAKKVQAIWKELHISNFEDLYAACQNGTVEKLKGFGPALQSTIQTQIRFIQENSKKLRLDKACILSDRILTILQQSIAKTVISGELRRHCEVITCLVFVIETEDIFGGQSKISLLEGFHEDFQASSPFTWRGYFEDNLIPIEIHLVDETLVVSTVFQHSAHVGHLQAIDFYNQFQGKVILSEESIYQQINRPFIVNEMREGLQEFEWAERHQINDLISDQDLQGCLHNHSVYSDGKNTLLEMAEACRDMGLYYFGIADHSQYAAYAGGLKEEDVYRQHEEIDQLNSQWTDFCILKGIEADILPDGSLDYNDLILSKFDYVVASVHAQLNMDLDKAMARIIRAIENPYTSILGHPTGRLLLSRVGYPLITNKILDACRANGVSIELNANPYRLDLDWRHIYAAMDKGVFVSINPDAHKIAGLKDMKYGVKVGQKGGLLKALTLNALPLKELKVFFEKN